MYTIFFKEAIFRIQNLYILFQNSLYTHIKFLFDSSLISDSFYMKRQNSDFKRSPYS